jgi:hypothetical protein
VKGSFFPFLHRLIFHLFPDPSSFHLIPYFVHSRAFHFPFTPFFPFTILCGHPLLESDFQSLGLLISFKKDLRSSDKSDRSCNVPHFHQLQIFYTTKTSRKYTAISGDLPIGLQWALLCYPPSTHTHTHTNMYTNLCCASWVSCQFSCVVHPFA